MKERPIIFSGPMVKAILEGTKTQTRRPIRPQPPDETAQLRIGITGYWTAFDEEDSLFPTGWYCPYGRSGDRLWVREGWRLEMNNGFHDIRYRADNYIWDPGSLYQKLKNRKCWIWRPSIFMPRWASRILLEITNVKVERIQEISESDAWAEGITIPGRVKKAADMMTSEYDDIAWCSIDGFAEEWDLFYAKKDFGWEANPWVWVIEFNMIESQPTLRLEKG